MRTWLALTVLLGAFATALAAAAVASPPDHFTDTSDYSTDTGATPSNCGSFDDDYTGHLDVHGITTFDKQGNPVTDVVHISGWEVNWRSDRPSVRFTAKRQWTVVYDYATNTEKDVGIIFSATAPGQGVLFHDVGNISFDDSTGNAIAVHGPHDVYAQGDAAYCNALLAIS
ncbi:MAG: hypothetical protein ACXVQZ_07845 [Gaiellaceae bacterium]